MINVVQNYLILINGYYLINALGSKDLVKLRNDLHEKTFDLTQTNESFAIASFILAALSVTEERLATELAHITTNTNETRAVLKKTEVMLIFVCYLCDHIII
jgi:hypothetical protein